jgi:hypothetical protein
MALSDDLSRLAVRAKEAEDRVGAARKKARSDLEAEVANARAVGEQQANELREHAEQADTDISAGWKDVQKSWNEAIAGIRADIESKHAKGDAHHAERRADRAEEDARFALDFAYSAIVEAEYTVLDAVLARAEADEKAAATA